MPPGSSPPPPPAGDLRITPILDQRMLLWGFRKPPAVNVKLAVKGPIGAGADLSQFQFIQVRPRARVLAHAFLAPGPACRRPPISLCLATRQPAGPLRPLARSAARRACL
jgi:hypothetical protein